MKKQIREALLQKRELHTATEEDTNKVVEKLLSLPQIKKAKSVLLYYPHKNEINTLPLINAFLKQGKTVLLPKVEGLNIIPVIFKDLSQLKEGYAGIKEPEGKAISPEEIDIVIVPGVAFDKKGHRLGYGKGYYDRFLSKTNALKIGLAYDFQIVENLPAEEHDVPLDLIITPTQIIQTKEERK